MNISPAKERLRSKLVGFQRKIAALSRQLQSGDERRRNREEALFLELMGMLDSFENIFSNMKEKEEGFDKPVKRALKSFRAIDRKLLRILEEHGVQRLEFPGGKAEPGLCRVIDTVEAVDCEEGSIVSIVCNGYRQGERILRPAVVITVANRVGT